jgi:hypothetical protein
MQFRHRFQPSRKAALTTASGLLALLMSTLALPMQAAEVESTAPGRDSDFSRDDTFRDDTFRNDGSLQDEPFEDAPNDDTMNDDSLNPVPGQRISSDQRFVCTNRGGEYTVMYQPESRPGQAFPWAVPQTLGGGWSADARCFEIARRLEEYRPDGLISLETGSENGYDILCVTTENNPDCRIVLTVPPGRDPMTTRNAVFENLLVADRGDSTSGVNTFVGSSGGLENDIIKAGGKIFGKRGRASASARKIPLKPYLDRADGGTGVALNNGVPLTNGTGGGKSLNPNRFR